MSPKKGIRPCSSKSCQVLTNEDGSKSTHFPNKKGGYSRSPNRSRRDPTTPRKQNGWIMDPVAIKSPIKVIIVLKCYVLISWTVQAGPLPTP